MSENGNQDKAPKLPKAPKRRQGDDKSPPPSNWRGMVLLLVAVSILLLAFFSHQTNLTGASKTLTWPEFLQAARDGKVEKPEVLKDPTRRIHWLEGKWVEGQEPEQGKTKKYQVTINPEVQKNLEQQLTEVGFSELAYKDKDSGHWQVLFSILPVILFIVVIYFIFRQQIKMAGKGAFNFGKSKAKILTKDRNKITFKDVAGVEEAKEEVSEIVEFLRDPKKFQRLGGRIPKGVLMVGPPGTGKTLLAKAIAGEADVPFYGISGSDFVEMFVGVGASRVRDMFEQGRRSAPCLIFIDEIDAVGRSRGHGLGGGHDEREQTLNALLVEMDGIDSTDGVIIIAATNRKDVLDPALLRPGRFDREVRVNLPDVKGREQILNVHSKKVKLDDSIDLQVIARGTPGFSGAELENLMNEAALLAARRNAKTIMQADLEEARDKVRWGRERRSMAMSEREKRITAYHEAGHAILNVLLEHTDPLHKVSIIPRGPALGVTMMLPQEDRYGYGRLKVLDEMCVAMGGRVAEEIFIKDVSSGASGDIRMATYYAKKMVCEWGMSDKLGMVQYGEQDDYVFLGKEMGKSRGYSEETAREIDQEVLTLTKDAYALATKLITENRETVEKITDALLEFETLEGSQVVDIIEHGEMKNPPKRDVDPPATPLPKEQVTSEDEEESRKSDDDMLPPEVAPAGA